MADVLRGFDSTGVIVGNDLRFDYFKKAVNAIDFLDIKPADKMLSSLPLNRPAFMIGHNRAATVGNVTSANAHPFHHGDLIGVHNGTLRRYHKLERDRDFDTDSETLYFNLSRNPITDVLSDIDGAYALVWYNTAEKTVNIVKNDERPLHIAKVKDEDTIMWASEPGMLRWIAQRNSISIDKMISPKEHAHIKIHIDGEAVSEFEIETLKVVNNYPTYTGTGAWGNHTKKPNAGAGNSNAGNNSGSKQKASGKGMTTEQVKQRLGLETMTKKYSVYCHEFEPYKTTPRFGVVRGYMTSSPHMLVEFMGVSREDFADMAGETVEVPFRSIYCNSNEIWDARAIAMAADIFKEGKSTQTFAVYNGPHGEKLDKQQMLSKTSGGCCICNSGISIQEFDYIDWLEDQPVCPSCVENDYSSIEA